MSTNPKRIFPFASKMQGTPPSKKVKSQRIGSEHKNANLASIFNPKSNTNTDEQSEQINKHSTQKKSHAPLAEKMRPNELIDYIGQTHLIGPNTLLHDLLKNGEIPSMILWGPPGCGKTSLVNVIMKESKKMSVNPVKFIKLSATTSNINEVRKAVAEAETQANQGQRTVVFMDEIHRFNKLQQDIFLPHVEAGTFVLIGATTENPSSGLNSALLSRCRVFILKKLQKSELMSILTKAIKAVDGEIVLKSKASKAENSTIKFFIDQKIIDWLAEVCDGDGRVALNGLEMAVQAKTSNVDTNKSPIYLDLNDIKNSLEKTLLDKRSDNLSHMHNALHHSILGDDDNAALYWLARIMEAREDPVYTARRLVRIASEDIDLNDEEALNTVVHTMHACQMIGMPECDVLLAQSVIYLARAEKSKEIIEAFRKVQSTVENHKGPQPKVPLFIKDRSGQKKLRATLGPNFTNLVRHENLKKCHLPEGLENVNFFDEQKS